ncbi:MAG: hypothetical protein NZ742_06650, partial [Acidobacteria bacterium]|nr:hypothetical protein [Acidobacteriota bacterium]MDW7984557.1 hypothetical protein [Acidobacteriota bacterium]
LQGEVRWLACREICVPGRQKVQLSVKVGQRPEASAYAETFRRFEALAPLRPSVLSGWQFQVKALASHVRLLEVRPPRGETVMGLEWFPEDPRLRVTGQTTELGAVSRLRIVLESLGDGPTTGSGVLQVQTPGRVFYVQFP